MTNKKQIKASCSSCIHKQVCYKKLEFPDIIPFIEETGICATFEPTVYDYIFVQLEGIGFDE